MQCIMLTDVLCIGQICQPRSEANFEQMKILILRKATAENVKALIRAVTTKFMENSDTGGGGRVEL